MRRMKLAAFKDKDIVSGAAAKFNKLANEYN
jgi:hypothetical protein